MADTPPRHRTTDRPPLLGALLYFLLNLPVGIAGFVVLLVLTVTGAATAIIWVGVPVAALAILVARGAAGLERARIHAMLGTYVPPPHRPLPAAAQKQRWRARLSDSATWRDYIYFFVLFPLGIVQFVVMVTCWSVSAALTFLPVHHRFLPGGVWHFPSSDPDLRWITVDSTVSALPWAALGVLLFAATVALTRGMARAHARFALVLLGPSTRRMREFDEEESTGTSTANPVAG